MFAVRACSALLKASASVSLRPRTFATEVKPAAITDALSRTEHLYKTYKPVSPGIRHLRRPIYEHLYEGRPLRLLTVARRKKGGRNSHGRITVRSIGGGHKQRIRIVDFMRSDPGPQDVIRIEYDPGRSAHIALVRARDARANGGRRFSYILATDGMRAGHVVESFRNGIPPGLVPGFVDKKWNARLSPKAASTVVPKIAPGPAGDSQASAQAVSQPSKEVTASETLSKNQRPDGYGAIETPSTASLALSMLLARTLHPGNVLPLRLIPVGTVVHNLSLHPDKPAKLVRSAGTSALVIAHDPWEQYSQVRLQSGEVRKLLQDCCATIGSVSNPLWKGRKLGKAGRSRWLGHRPRVRGMAMNRVDHPHGGGRGKSKGNKHPRSIWGWLTKGKRTRRPGPKGPKNSNKMVVKERPRGKEKTTI